MFKNNNFNVYKCKHVFYAHIYLSCARSFIFKDLKEGIVKCKLNVKAFYNVSFITIMDRLNKLRYACFFIFSLICSGDRFITLNGTKLYFNITFDVFDVSYNFLTSIYYLIRIIYLHA